MQVGPGAVSRRTTVVERSASVTSMASPLNRTLIVGGLFAVAGDCLGTVAEFLSDIGRAHAVHYQQQVAGIEFARSVQHDIDRLLGE
jgi:hypothetical protein